MDHKGKNYYWEPLGSLEHISHFHTLTCLLEMEDKVSNQRGLRMKGGGASLS